MLIFLFELMTLYLLTLDTIDILCFFLSKSLRKYYSMRA